MRAPAPIRTGPITFAPVPMLTSRSIVAPLQLAGAQADRDERRDHGQPAPISTTPSITTWPWTQVHARLDHHGIADRDLRP